MITSWGSPTVARTNITHAAGQLAARAPSASGIGPLNSLPKRSSSGQDSHLLDDDAFSRRP